MTSFILLDFCSMPLLAWLLPFILGLALGWALWAKYKNLLEECRAQNAALETRITGLNDEINSNHAKIADLVGDVAIADGRMKEAYAALAALQLTAGKDIKKDDLKIVEGIGPKIEEVLFSAGIYTFNALSNTQSSLLTDILRAAGPQYQIADPSTWPKQALLADQGKWDELKEYQNFLNAGKE